MRKNVRTRYGALAVTVVGLLLAIGCTKDETTVAENGTTGPLKDVDGNIYQTVTIGTQTWMAENLKTTKYTDRTRIPNITDSAAWSTQSEGALCDYDTLPSNADTYGKLYNWYAVHSGRLCPAGWHIPTNAEWTALADHLGGEYSAGGRIKATDTILWKIPNIGASDITGFAALPSGHRNEEAVFNGMGLASNWWSADERTPDNAWFQYVNSISTVLGRNDISKKAGFSVRCIKD